jgi:hypothetical protein
VFRSQSPRWIPSATCIGLARIALVDGATTAQRPFLSGDQIKLHDANNSHCDFLIG